MRIGKKSAAGLLLFGLSGASMAAHPPLDRPTPPPCCADGQAISRAQSFGVYGTRWRPWPLECPAPNPAAPFGPGAPSQLPQDIQPFQLPNKEDEDQRAPPPTAPREEPLRTQQPTNAAPSNTGPVGPGNATGPAELPRTGPGIGPGLQPDQTEPTRRPGALPPYEPSGGSLYDNPMGDVDPPPALPFSRPLVNPAPVREVRQAPAAPTRQPPAARSNTPNDDPPPSLPVALAALSN